MRVNKSYLRTYSRSKNSEKEQITSKLQDFNRLTVTRKEEGTKKENKLLSKVNSLRYEITKGSQTTTYRTRPAVNLNRPHLNLDALSTHGGIVDKMAYSVKGKPVLGSWRKKEEPVRPVYRIDI